MSTQKALEIVDSWMNDALSFRDFIQFQRLQLIRKCLLASCRNEN